MESLSWQPPLKVLICSRTDGRDVALFQATLSWALKLKQLEWDSHRYAQKGDKARSAWQRTQGSPFMVFLKPLIAWNIQTNLPPKLDVWLLTYTPHCISLRSQHILSSDNIQGGLASWSVSHCYQLFMHNGQASQIWQATYSKAKRGSRENQRRRLFTNQSPGVGARTI